MIQKEAWLNIDGFIKKIEIMDIPKTVEIAATPSLIELAGAIVEGDPSEVEYTLMSFKAVGCERNSFGEITVVHYKFERAL